MSRSEELRAYLNSLPDGARQTAKAALRIMLHRQDAATWAFRELDLSLDPWQRSLVATSPGGRAIALVHRQAGKTTAAAVTTSHHLIFGPAVMTQRILLKSCG